MQNNMGDSKHTREIYAIDKNAARPDDKMSTLQVNAMEKRNGMMETFKTGNDKNGYATSEARHSALSELKHIILISAMAPLYSLGRPRLVTTFQTAFNASWMEKERMNIGSNKYTTGVETLMQLRYTNTRRTPPLQTPCPSS